MAVVEVAGGEGGIEMVLATLAIAGMLGAGAFGWFQGKKASGLDPLWFVVAVAGGVVAGAILASKE
jgi:predicted permease